MKYRDNLKCHFTPLKGWINDPNGLVYFKGKYHIFYQHCPTREERGGTPHWGHATTTDFINWEHLPIALYPDKEYDNGACASGTAIVKDDTLYIFYSGFSIHKDADRCVQVVNIAISHDGINFEKYERNPIISSYPPEGCPDFRDPSIMEKDGKYYLALASGNPEAKSARILLYESTDLFDWKYSGIMHEWENRDLAECPSFLKYGDKFLLAASVFHKFPGENHYFSLMYGDFDGKKFKAEICDSVDMGPDQFAGQAFVDHKGRAILISWASGWHWSGVMGQDIGCLTVPKEIIVKNGRIYCYPVEEVRHLLKDSDPAVEYTDDGFIIKRNLRECVVHKGEVKELKIIRDDYLIEVFVNGGEYVYTAILF